jgi:hypothetical protein
MKDVIIKLGEPMSVKAEAVHNRIVLALQDGQEDFGIVIEAVLGFLQDFLEDAVKADVLCSGCIREVLLRMAEKLPSDAEHLH